MKGRIVGLVLVVLFSVSCKKQENDPISEPEDIVDTEADIILYSKNPNNHNELYRLEAGEETLVLSDPEYDYWWAKVSHDKSKFLVYRSPVNPAHNHDDYENATLMLYNIDGTEISPLITPGSYGWNAQGVCRWNEDDTKILMAADMPTSVGDQWRVVVTDAMGDNPKVIANYWAIDPNFSSTDEYVVFIGFPDNNLSLDLSQLELHRGEYDEVNDTLINITRLTFNNTRDHDPSYSSDDKKIVFSAGNADYTDVDIAVYNANTTTVFHVVDDAAANGGSMCWSTFEESIYFHSLNLSAHPFRIKKVDLSSEIVTDVALDQLNNFSYYHPEAY